MKIKNPEASPHAGVRFLSNKPKFIFLGICALVMIVIATIAAKKSSKAQVQPAPVQQDSKPATTAKQDGGMALLQMMPSTGMIPAKEVRTPAPVISESVSQNATDLNTPPTPTKDRPRNSAPPSAAITIASTPELERFKQAKLSMFEDALTAKTGITVEAPRATASSLGSPTTPANNGYVTKEPQTREEMLARMKEVRAKSASAGSNGANGSPPAPNLTSMSGEGGSGYQQFDGDSNRWSSGSHVEAPGSPYELRAGFVIPATLISGINSGLPGQIIAQVSQNVYDTATGQHNVIPQGSRLVGSYSSQVSPGQSRLLVAWQRIIYPDGKALDLGSMPGADSAGYAGFNDQVNTHAARMFGSALLMSAITAGITMSQDYEDDDNDDDSTSFEEAMVEGLGQQLGQVTAEMIRQHMNTAPTLEIRPGYRFNVVVTKDLTFSKPYEPFDY